MIVMKKAMVEEFLIRGDEILNIEELTDEEKRKIGQELNNNAFRAIGYAKAESHEIF